MGLDIRARPIHLTSYCKMINGEIINYVKYEKVKVSKYYHHLVNLIQW